MAGQLTTPGPEDEWRTHSKIGKVRVPITMPEALAVVAVVVVTIVAWVGAWMHARNPANHNPRAELERLRHQEVWLRQRIDLAQREGWSGEMVANLEQELAQTAEALQARAG